MRSALEQRLKRLLLFRVVMVTTLLLIAVLVESASETLLRVNPLYFLIAATYALTLVHILIMRFAGPGELAVHAQVVGDLIIISGLVYLTGGTGTRAGFMLLYPISVLSGSVLLSRNKGMILAGLASFFYGAILWSVRMRIVPPQGLPDVPSMPVKHLVFSVFVAGVACATVALIGGHLSESLKNAGEQLEEVTGRIADLQELNQVIVDSIQSGLIMAGADGRVLYVNALGAATLKRPLSDIRGKTMHEVFRSVFFDAPALVARTSDRGLARLEVAYDQPDGTRLDLGVSVSPLKTARPRERGFLVVFQDLTDIKRLEREVQMNEKLAAVGEMAAHLAHEIRNPLGSISGSAQVLMAEPNMSAEQERLLSIITSESRRLSGTLDQFLFQVRPSPAELGPVDLGAVIAEAVALLQNSADVGPDHRVEFRIEGGPHVVRADPDRMRQVFWNVARNGIEAMPEGGTLRIRLAAAADCLRLSVRDEGRGIGHEQQKLLFEPFRPGKGMGTGLGLAIVYKIVRDHGGDISVKSVPGEGTEVEVRLPSVTPNAAMLIA